MKKVMLAKVAVTVALASLSGPATPANAAECRTPGGSMWTSQPMYYPVGGGLAVSYARLGMSFGCGVVVGSGYIHGHCDSAWGEVTLHIVPFDLRTTTWFTWTAGGQMKFANPSNDPVYALLSMTVVSDVLAAQTCLPLGPGARSFRINGGEFSV